MEISKYPKLLIQELAKAQGLTLTLLIQQTKLAPDTVRKYWYSQIMRLDWNNLRIFAKVLGTTPLQLIIDEDMPVASETPYNDL